MEMGSISPVVYGTLMYWVAPPNIICKSQGERIYNNFDLLMAVIIETVGLIVYTSFDIKLNIDIRGFFDIPHHTYKIQNDHDKYS